MLPDIQLSDIEQMDDAENQLIVGGKRSKFGFLKFNGKVRNGSPNSSILNRLTGKRLG